MKPGQELFVVTVNGRFFKGVAPVVIPEGKPKTRYLPEPFPHPWFRPYRISSRDARDNRKGTKAKYRTPKTVIDPTPKIVTNHLVPKLVDDLSDAKKFKSIQKAKRACEKLKECYFGLDIKVKIETYKGENK